MKTIVLIGAGQLGSRHLQGLSKIDFLINIEVVDPCATSLEVAQSRFNEMPSNPNISGVRYYSSLTEISRGVDLAIVATNADIRASVIRTLLQHCDVKNLVLEKVLFQKPEEYFEIQTLLESKGINAWVNHPRRMFPYYTKLMKLLAGSKTISYQVEGGEWGMACNGLHFIDHLAFLTGCDDLKVNTDRLNPTVIKSKRKGFIEVNGVLSGTIGSHPFELICLENSRPLVITICSDNLNAIIHEGDGLIRFSGRDTKWQWVEEKERIIYYQSELTNKVVQNIIETGHCSLPSLFDATKLHLPFVNALIEHVNRYDNEKHLVCPIT